MPKELVIYAGLILPAAEVSDPMLSRATVAGFQGLFWFCIKYSRFQHTRGSFTKVTQRSMTWLGFLIRMAKVEDLMLWPGPCRGNQPLLNMQARANNFVRLHLGLASSAAYWSNFPAGHVRKPKLLFFSSSQTLSLKHPPTSQFRGSFIPQWAIHLTVWCVWPSPSGCRSWRKGQEPNPDQLPSQDMCRPCCRSEVYTWPRKR